VPKAFQKKEQEDNMKFHHAKKAVALAAASIGLVVGMSAVGVGAASGSSSTTLFMLPKFTGIPPFTQADVAAAAQAKVFGYTLKYGGPTSSSATEQVSFINEAVAAGDKGIFADADNPAAITPALQRAEAHGVKVISWDSDTLPAGRTVYVQGTSATSIAQTELNMLGSQIGYSGSFVILSAEATDSNQVLWNNDLKADLKTMSKYKNMKLLTIVNPPDDSAASATTYMQSILSEYPSIKGVIAPTTVAIAAAAQVLQQQKLCSKYVLTGLGDPSQMKSYVTSGCVKQFALWSFGREGTVAMCAMHAALTGTLTGKTGQSFTCGSFGSISVATGGVVTAGPAEVFSKANLSAFTF
jgi:rhamnose transport system substrate-binding protein